MKAIQICFVLMLFLGLSGCFKSSPNPVDETYAVYSTILNNIERNSQNGKELKLFVINEFTDVDKDSSQPLDEVLQNLRLELKQTDYISPEDLADNRAQLLPSSRYAEAVEDFKIKNKESKQLTKSFNLKQDYVLMNRNDFNALMKDKGSSGGWKSFYVKYPNSAGFITLSRVGFDKGINRAFVYFEQMCGDLCAQGTYILLEKQAGVWKEIAHQKMWVS